LNALASTFFKVYSSPSPWIAYLISISSLAATSLKVHVSIVPSLCPAFSGWTSFTLAALVTEKPVGTKSEMLMSLLAESPLFR
jgi:hypothetical protein